MWKLIPEKLMPPTRRVRYCCKGLKEQYGEGRLLVFGVRAAESVRRAKAHGIVTVLSEDKDKRARYMQDNPETVEIVSACYTKQKHSVNPVVDWLNEDVWEFINAENVPYCELYNEGFDRLGCIGCPMAKRRERIKEFERWPKFKDSYLRAFDRMLKVRRDKELITEWNSAEEVMDWWLNDKNLDKPIEGQISLEEP
jgi:phosphoadenosine phosphosulfate reductase